MEFSKLTLLGLFVALTAAACSTTSKSAITTETAAKETQTADAPDRMIAGVRASTFTASFCDAMAKQRRRRIELGSCKRTGKIEPVEAGDPMDPQTGQATYAYEGKLVRRGHMVRCLADRLNGGGWKVHRCNDK